MCGAESASLEPRKVSGSVLRVCTSCAGMGKQLLTENQWDTGHLLRKRLRRESKKQDTKISLLMKRFWLVITETLFERQEKGKAWITYLWQ